jgi:hypothetical protein
MPSLSRLRRSTAAKERTAPDRRPPSTRTGLGHLGRSRSAWPDVEDDPLGGEPQGSTAHHEPGDRAPRPAPEQQVERTGGRRQPQQRVIFQADAVHECGHEQRHADERYPRQVAGERLVATDQDDGEQ